MKKILSVILASFLMVGCSDDFLDKQPIGAITSSELLNSKEACELALHNIYATSMKSYTQYWTPMFDEARADQIGYMPNSGSSLLNVFDYKQGLADNGAGYAFWLDGYNVINACNKIISEELVGIKEQEVRDDYIAQAKTMRAKIYLDLLNAFSIPVHNNATENMGVPVVTEVDYHYYPVRAKVIENYQLIIDDLLFAVNHLQHDIQPEIVNQAFAHGLLTRVYMNLAGPIGSTTTYNLTIGNKTSITSDEALQEAIKSANRVLSIVQPNNNWSGLQFGVARILDETIFASISNQEDNGWTGTSYYCAQWDSRTTVSQTVRMYTELVDKFAADDLRRKYFYDYGNWYDYYEVYEAAGLDYLTASRKEVVKSEIRDLGGHRIFGKFAPKDFQLNSLDDFLEYPNEEVEYTQGFGDYNLMRASEIALLKAEACMRSGDASNALEAYKSVVSRYRPSLVISTVTLNDILRQKELEFIGEGLRMRDLLRWGQDFSRPESSTTLVKDVKLTDYHMQLPIPDGDIKVNENLDQNPGYGK